MKICSQVVFKMAFDQTSQAKASDKNGNHMFFFLRQIGFTETPSYFVDHDLGRCGAVTFGFALGMIAALGLVNKVLG